MECDQIFVSSPRPLSLTNSINSWGPVTLPPLKCRRGRLSEVSLLGAVSIVLVEKHIAEIMERYVKIAGPSGKWIKIFMSTDEVNRALLAFYRSIFHRSCCFGVLRIAVFDVPAAMLQCSFVCLYNSPAVIEALSVFRNLVKSISSC